MEIKEAIEILKEMKENCVDKSKTFYKDDKRIEKAQAIETVLKELDNSISKDKIKPMYITFKIDVPIDRNISAINSLVFDLNALKDNIEGNYFSEKETNIIIEKMKIQLDYLKKVKKEE